MSVEHSRMLKLAAGASTKNASALERHLESTVTSVSVASEMPHAELTARTLLTTLRRGPGQILLVAGLLDRGFVEQIHDTMNSIDPDRGMHVIGRTDRIPERAIRVHVGPHNPEAAIRIAPEGYGAHIAGSAAAVIRPKRPPNEIGAIYTAALGAAEVFKHSASVLPDRRVLHRHLTFCPMALSSDLSAAPDLRLERDLELTLVGIGAIGTGIALLLGAIGAEARILLIDRQRFAKENLGTYSIGTFADVVAAPWKVDLVKLALAGFNVTVEHISVADTLRLVDIGRLPWSRIVMTGLDSPEARRDAQRLWPDRLIDAQTGDTMLGLCDHRHSLDPCMFCVFPVNREGPSGAEIVARQLGLSVEEIAAPDAVLTEAHLVGKTAEQETLLRPHIGTLMCGLAQAVGLTRLAAGGFMPSVPFVSLQAACLSVSRLIAATHGLFPANANFVQYDALFGPQAATIELMRRRPGCVCQTRVASIERVRERRRARQSQS